VLGMTISSDDEQIVKDLPGNTKIPQIEEGDAESRLHNFRATLRYAV